MVQILLTVFYMRLLTSLLLLVEVAEVLKTVEFRSDITLITTSTFSV